MLTVQSLRAQRAQIWKAVLKARHARKTAKQAAVRARAKVEYRQAVARLEQVRKQLAGAAKPRRKAA